MSIPASEIPTKSYRTACSGGGEYFGAPALATFAIGQETAAFIVEMAQFVQRRDLTTISRYDLSASFFEIDPDELDPEEDDEDGNELRTECDRLVVSEDRFWFTCYRRHHDHLISTEAQPVDELAAHFGLDFNPKASLEILAA